MRQICTLYTEKKKLLSFFFLLENSKGGGILLWSKKKMCFDGSNRRRRNQHPIRVQIQHTTGVMGSPGWRLEETKGGTI